MSKVEGYVAIEYCHVHLCFSNPVGLSVLRKINFVLIQYNQVGCFPTSILSSRLS